MKYLKVVLLLALSSFATPKETGETTLRKMYHRYHGRWHKTLRFTQQTERYRNDSLVSTDTWYETIVYPKQFRIDFGIPFEGNCVIFRNDSAYIFKNKTLTKSRIDTNDLLFILGGMYFAPSFDEVQTRFSGLHYNLAKGHRTRWKGRPVFVIGADNDDDEANQLWVESENYYVVRFLKFENGRKEEGVMEGHKSLGKSWCETLVSFYIDNKLIQKEKYTQILADEKTDAILFSPGSPWLHHWYKPVGNH